MSREPKQPMDPEQGRSILMGAWLVVTAQYPDDGSIITRLSVHGSEEEATERARTASANGLYARIVKPEKLGYFARTFAPYDWNERKGRGRGRHSKHKQLFNER